MYLLARWSVQDQFSFLVPMYNSIDAAPKLWKRTNHKFSRKIILVSFVHAGLVTTLINKTKKKGAAGSGIIDGDPLDPHPLN